MKILWKSVKYLLGVLLLVFLLLGGYFLFFFAKPHFAGITNLKVVKLEGKKMYMKADIALYNPNFWGIRFQKITGNTLINTTHTAFLENTNTFYLAAQDTTSVACKIILDIGGVHKIYESLLEDDTGVLDIKGHVSLYNFNFSLSPHISLNLENLRQKVLHREQEGNSKPFYTIENVSGETALSSSVVHFTVTFPHPHNIDFEIRKLNIICKYDGSLGKLASWRLPQPLFIKANSTIKIPVALTINHTSALFSTLTKDQNVLRAIGNCELVVAEEVFKLPIDFPLDIELPF